MKCFAMEPIEPNNSKYQHNRFIILNHNSHNYCHLLKTEADEVLVKEINDFKKGETARRRPSDPNIPFYFHVVTSDTEHELEYSSK